MYIYIYIYWINRIEFTSPVLESGCTLGSRPAWEPVYSPGSQPFKRKLLKMTIRDI